MERYSGYNDSGVEWIGEIPLKWEEIKLKHLTQKIGSGITPRGGAEVYLDSGIPLIRSQNVHFDGLQLEKVAYISQEIHDSMSSTKIKPNDVLFNITGASIGRCSYVPNDFREANVNQHVCIIRPNRKVGSQYLKYLLESIVGQSQVFHSQVGTSREGLNFEQLKNFIFCLPAEGEQDSIVAFLNHKTHLIDTLIEKKQKQIELLQEQRAAVINQAVTKGLNPNVKMKDSGIEWLGEVPEHWEIKRLKHISPKQTVGVVVNPSSYFSDEGVPFLLGNNVLEGKFNTGSVRTISPESNEKLKKSMLRSGDLAVVRVGYPGTAAVVPPELDGCNCASIMIVRKDQSFDSHWLCYSINSAIGKYQVDVVKYGAAQKQYNISHAVEFWYPVPPYGEQSEIRKEIDKKSEIIDDSICKLQKHVDLIQEYRTTLISEVVTGKIDVRNEVIP